MATAIRMRRGGRRHAPYYRVIVVDSRKRSRGQVIDQIGVYQPCSRPEPVIEIDQDKALAWLAKGARPSDTVRNVFTKKGIMAAFASGGSPAAADAGVAEEAAGSEAPQTEG